LDPCVTIGAVMKKIDAIAAQHDFEQLLDEVQQGEGIVITRNGKPIGRLISEDEGRRQEARRASEATKS
jgi:prevent-host-death family protein